MAAANNEFFEALSMLEHERGITAEYLIEKIKATPSSSPSRRTTRWRTTTSWWISTPPPAALMWP